MNARGKAGDRLQTRGLVLINLFKQTRQGEGEKAFSAPPSSPLSKSHYQERGRRTARGPSSGVTITDGHGMHTTLSLSLPRFFSFEMECFEDLEVDYMVLRGRGLSKTGSFVSSSRLLTSWPFIPSKQKPNFSVYHSERVWGREEGRAGATKAARKRWVYTLRDLLEQKKTCGGKGFISGSPNSYPHMFCLKEKSTPKHVSYPHVEVFQPLCCIFHLHFHCFSFSVSQHRTMSR